MPGVLTLTDFAKMWSIKKGGPLGDLVQWTDLILGLAFLGHNVTVVKNLMAASQMYSLLSPKIIMKLYFLQLKCLMNG